MKYDRAGVFRAARLTTKVKSLVASNPPSEQGNKNIGGKQVDSRELDGLTKKAEKLEDKHVQVVAKLSHRHGVELGDWAVLEVVSIKQFKS